VLFYLIYRIIILNYFYFLTMKKRFSIFLLAMLVNFSFAQVGINTTSPDASAELDVFSNSKGLLLPRLTTTAINTLTATASEGLIVFNTTTKQFWGYNGTSWQILTTSNAPTGTPVTATFASWELSGMPGGTNNFGASPLAGTVSQITAASLTRGTGISTTGTGSQYAWGGTGYSTSASTSAAAVTSNQFFNFTLTLPSSAMFSFTKISAHNIRRSNTGPTAIQWQYSINGGAFTDIGSAISAGSVTNSAGNPIAEISLSSISALQNLSTTTTSVVFRMVMYGASNVGGTFYLNDPTGIVNTVNDLEIIGTYQ
jgi:hypothetical protein